MRAALLLLLLATPAIAAAEKAYVVASDQPAFTEAAKAAVLALGGDAELLRADDAAKDALAGAGVVVAVGPLADRLVNANAGANLRVVACLTPRSSGTHSVSVPLQPSATDVLALVRVVLPSVHKVGVFTSAGSNQSEIVAAARDSGLEVVFPRNGEAFAAAVDRLTEVADLVWIEDSASVPNGGAALVVKKASDEHKQVIGPNRATVMQGAFFAVVPDPTAHGKAAGEAAARMLKGDDVRSVPAPVGRIVINGALAKTLGMKIPATVAKRAEMIE